VSAGTRILVVEDHPLVRDGIRSLLELDGRSVCGEAENRAEALALLAETRPDLIMVDISLGLENGLDLIRSLAEPHPPVLVYSMHEDWLHVRQAFQAGALGYVTKRELSDVLLEAVRTVLAGTLFTSARASRAIAVPDQRVNLQGMEQFSTQEKEIFRLLSKGLGIGAVAEAAGLSRKTVETYCGRMMIKTDLQGMKELRILAVEFGEG